MTQTSTRTIRRWIAASALVVALALGGRTVSAQIFGGIVYDPTNYANAVLRYGQLQQQLAQLIATYQQLRADSLFMEMQARRLPLIGQAARYLGQRTPWRLLNAGTTYGRTRFWITAANTGQNTPFAVAQATEVLNGYGSALGTRAPEEARRIQERVDRTMLDEGAVGTALETVGRLRANETTVEARLRNLEDDTFTDDTARQTEVAVLNKINVAGVTAARIAKDTNHLLVSALEHQMLEATERREATAQALNAHAAFLAEAPALLAASTSDTTRALTSFRIP